LIWLRSLVSANCTAHVFLDSSSPRSLCGLAAREESKGRSITKCEVCKRYIRFRENKTLRGRKHRYPRPGGKYVVR
jgi:hypothetical protein